MTKTIIYSEPYGQFAMKELALREYGHPSKENLYFLGLHPLAQSRTQAFKAPVWQGIVSEKELIDFKTFKKIRVLQNIFYTRRHSYYLIPEFNYEKLSQYVTDPQYNLATARVTEDLLMRYPVYQRHDNAKFNTPHYGNFFERPVRFFDLMDNPVYFSPQIYLGSFSENSEQAFDIRHDLLKDKSWQDFVAGIEHYQHQSNCLYIGQNDLFSEHTTLYHKDLTVPFMKNQPMLMAFDCEPDNMRIAYEKSLQVMQIEPENAYQSELVQNIASLILLKIENLDQHLGLDIMSLSKYIFQKDRGQILTHEKRTRMAQLFLYYDLEQSMQDKTLTIKNRKI